MSLSTATTIPKKWLVPPAREGRFWPPPGARCNIVPRRWNVHSWPAQVPPEEHQKPGGLDTTNTKKKYGIKTNVICHFSFMDVIWIYIVWLHVQNMGVSFNRPCSRTWSPVSSKSKATNSARRTSSKTCFFLRSKMEHQNRSKWNIKLHFLCSNIKHVQTFEWWDWLRNKSCCFFISNGMELPNVSKCIGKIWKKYIKSKHRPKKEHNKTSHLLVHLLPILLAHCEPRQSASHFSSAMSQSLAQWVLMGSGAMWLSLFSRNWSGSHGLSGLRSGKVLTLLGCYFCEADLGNPNPWVVPFFSFWGCRKTSKLSRCSNGADVDVPAHRSTLWAQHCWRCLSAWKALKKHSKYKTLPALW